MPVLRYYDENNWAQIASNIFDFTVALNTDWSGSTAPFSKTVSVTGIKSTDVPIVDVILSGNYAADMDAIVSWSGVYRVTTANNSMTFYADSKPEVPMSIKVRVVR